MKSIAPLRNGLGIIAGVVLSLLAPGGLGFTQRTTQSADSNWTDTFPVEEFSTTGVNRYFILQPGHFLILEGQDGRRQIQLTITVLNETKTVDGVETRVVEEREKNLADDTLMEVSRNYIAIGKGTNSVYYFGEDVDMYKDNKVASHEGAWQSGINGARFGVLMPGIALLGSRYYQEIAPGVAMDRAENVSLTETVSTPAGSFKNCLKVRETTMLEPAVRDFKIYAAGIGMVQENDLKLIKYGSR